MSTVKSIKKIEKKYSAIVEGLLEKRPMIRGTLKEIYRRCGKMSCWCIQEEKGHPAVRITWTEGGKNYTKAVADTEFDWVKKLTRNYKKFRKARQELRALQINLKLELDKLEKEIIEDTNRQRKAS